MTTKHLLTAILLTTTIPTFAQTETDSVNYSLDLNEFVLTGARSEIDVRHLSQTVSVISRAEIEESLQPSLLPVLTEEVPGLFTTSRGVMGYGVSDGAAGGISLRGLSGSSARMMVLIDGHPQYAGIFGHPISDAYQSMLAEKIEVLRGPASVLYGSNAMGGVVNIVTRKMKEDGVHTGIKAGYGSFNTLESEATNMIRKGGFTSTISGSYNRTEGHRENMGFEQYGGYAKFGYDINKHWSLSADVNVTHYNAHNPGSVSAPLEEGFQSITRGMTSVGAFNQYEKTSGGATFFYNWGRHRINDGYIPSEGETPLDDRFNSFDDMMGVSLYQSAQFFKGNRVTFGVDWFRYGGHAWSEYVSGERAGTTSDLVNLHQNEVAGYIDFRQNIGTLVTLNAGIRVDYHEAAGVEWVPQAGVAFHLPYSIELKASAGKGFRYPTLREMYMFPPQNPDLKAESLWNYEIAFSQKLLEGRLDYGLNVFYIDAKNLIMTLPNPSGTGRLNQNSGRIQNAGVEAQIGWRISQSWSVDANYSFLHMETPVIAAPQHKLYVGGMFAKGRWNVSTGVQYIAGLYTSTSPVVTEDFVLWNIRFSVRVAKGIVLWARGENLLAQQYEINLGYPMPKATVMVGLKVGF